MAKKEDAPAQEIVIIRRRGGGEDDHHHGGVWKIAFADFMTALMAFFLVMWLINASNTETKVALAAYFNPIKLTDMKPLPKGPDRIDEAAPDSVNEKGEVKGSPTKSKHGTAAPAEGKPAGEKSKGVDKAATSPSRDEKPAAGTAGFEQGRMFRDPFTPAKPSLKAEETTAVSIATAQSVGGTLASEDIRTSQNSRRAAENNERPEGAAPSKVPDPLPAAAGGSTAPDPSRTQEAVASRLLSEITSAIASTVTAGVPGIDVVVEGDGVVVSLTDTNTFGMFAIGSSDPSPELTKLMERIAPIIAANSDQIVVRGHTDARPYRGQRGNNWRLSLARAEIAYGILVKAGIDEARLERIEAHADRKPKVASDSTAAANRRIEILLRKAVK